MREIPDEHERIAAVNTLRDRVIRERAPLDVPTAPVRNDFDGQTCSTCRYWKRGWRAVQGPWMVENPVGTPSQWGRCFVNPPSTRNENQPFPDSHQDDVCRGYMLVIKG